MTKMETSVEKGAGTARNQHKEDLTGKGLFLKAVSKEINLKVSVSIKNNS